jgi:large-conductance mechanosensitive channel
MIVRNWVDVLAGSLQDLWGTLIGFLPALIGAIIVLIVGAIIASILERVVDRLVHYLKIDELLRKLGVEQYLQRGNIKLSSGHFLGRVVYWFLIIAFVLAASDILRFFTLSAFLRDVLNFIPDIIVAALILLATLVVANFLRGLVKTSAMGAKLHSAQAIGTVTWWVVFVFGFLTALLQVGVAVSVINTVITGLIAMLAIAGGLAFGLGGKELAADLLKKMRDQLR